MDDAFFLEGPKIQAPLDAGFRPAVLANRSFLRAVGASGKAVPLVLGMERGDGSVSRYETQVFADAAAESTSNFLYVERLVKFLLWQRGACRIHVGGSALIGDRLQEAYRPGGARAFDAAFMGDDVYRKKFTVVPCSPEDVPAEQDSTAPLGRHLEGCRIGFDLGASDLKVSAVVDGEAIYSDEIVWEPRKYSDPMYHVNAVRQALQVAAGKMPQVDAIGGSSAGVYINDRPMIASLFRGISSADYGVVREMFVEFGKEWGVPISVVNDGEVTALAGAMSLEEDGILGIALGSSEAGGYVTPEGNITNWLNELAFCPVDYNPDAPRDEWSGDYGVGALYFSQQCVFRLAPEAGIKLPEDVTDAERLKHVQSFLEEGHEGARKIWETMGVYLGYALAHYADFYDMRHVLVLGRCTSGSGGEILVDGAVKVLESEFPEIADSIQVQLPDEKSRRVGQSIAAASLPELSTDR